MYRIKTNSELESFISSTIESHRQQAYSLAEGEMYKAFGEIAALMKDTDTSIISERKISGISARTIRRIAHMAKDGITDFKEARDNGTFDEETHLNHMVEFLKVRSLTFEATRIRYPNYLKPWTATDDRELERLWCEGVPVNEMASMFKRNIGAIQARIEKLELQEKYM